MAGGGSGDPFDYYIDPAGDDNNAGSLASPWSITALNTKMSTYRGKRVGLLPGTHDRGRVGGTETTLYSLLNAGGGNTPILNIDGGASSSVPTYIGSSDSSGNYSARTATIDGRNPSGFGYATPEKSFLGQSDGSSLTNGGNVTIEGIILKGTVYRGIAFYRIGGVSGVIIKGCWIDGGRCAVSNNNPGLIYLQSHTDVLVQNCKLNDAQTLGGTATPWGMAGLMSFNGTGLIVENCTFTDLVSIDGKNDSQDAIIRYNYMDCGSFGNASYNGYLHCITDMLAGSGKTTSIHHNIMLGGRWGRSNNTTSFSGSEEFYNNTMYVPRTSYWYETHMNLTTSARISRYNNLYWSVGSPSTDPNSIFMVGMAITPTQLIKSNNNVYRTGALFAPEGYADNGRNLSSWQSYNGYGFDTDSQLITSTPFSGTPASGDVASFAITGAASTGGEGGTPAGALDGTGTVGTDW